MSSYPTVTIPDHKLSRSPIARMAWALSAAICLLAIENIWVDPWAARRFNHRFPSFVADPMSGVWLLELMLLAIGVILALVCQVLLMKDARMAVWRKVLTGLVVLLAAILSGHWFFATGGTEVSAWTQSLASHSVTLRWNASTTKNVRYNVYRGTTPGSHPDKLTPTPIDDLEFTDKDVRSGATYYYVARAVDPSGKESPDSNETTVKIP